MVSSIFLFVGMGINYQLLDKEKKAEERKEREEPKDEHTAMLGAPSPSSTDDSANAVVTLDDVAKMDEDTV